MPTGRQPLAESGTDAPDGSLLYGFLEAWPNPKTRSVLLWISHQAANSTTTPRNLGLVWAADDSLKTVIAPGQKLPDGAELLSVDTVSEPNSMGQHVFVARLKGGGSAAYLLNPDNSLSLVLKSGTITQHGTITKLSGDARRGEPFGIGLNSKGQILLPIQFEDSPLAVVLLSPAS
jgi:hypothetical protein